MHDVLPPSFNRDSYGKPAARRSRSVRVNWRLPARLRKPVRQQLKKERRRQKQREAIISFERRPLLTKKTSPRIESNNQRQLQSVVGLPPYAGSFTNRALNPKPAQPRRSPISRPKKPEGRRTLQVSLDQVNRINNNTVKPRAKISRRIDTRTQDFPKPKVAPVQKIKPAPAFNMLQAERDVPFSWDSYPSKEVPVFEEKQIPVQEQREEMPLPVEHHTGSLSDLSENKYPLPPASLPEKEVEVVQPQSRFSLPFTLNIWPVTSKKKLQFRLKPKEGILKKTKVVNLSLLLVGSLMMGAIMWNLQGIGRGLIAINNVQGQAQEIYDHLILAQSALAETDFDATESAFSDAENVLLKARAEIDEAFAASKYVLRWMDVTGTVRSGDKLLLAGEKLTQAGQHSARGFSLLMNSKLVINEVSEVEEGDVPLVKAIVLAKEEILAATELLDEASEALQKVDSPLLPGEVSSQVDVMKEAVPKVNKLLKEFTNQSDIFLDVLGANYSRQYLLLFANNHEIRPVGGFIGSIGLVNVDKGVVEQIDVKSVYDMDGQLKEFISPPDPLLPITDRWFMRDANWFVDYTVSAEKIAHFFEKQGGSTVDGVILMTPEVIRNLLEISGPIELPQYDITVNKDNFYLITQDKVTYTYDQEENKPKQFLADLTPVLLNRLFSDEDKSGLEVINALSKSLRQKDLLLYFKNQELQNNLVELGFAGTLPKDAQGFLMVNNANIGGHKSDQFVDQEIDYRTQIKDNNDVEIVVTIRRTHNGPSEALDYDYPDNEDPAYKNNIIYQRVLVPKGAKLLEAKGFSTTADIPSFIIKDHDLPLTVDNDVARWQSGQTRAVNDTSIGEEAGYTFFANWIVTTPGETSVVLYRYILPGHAKKGSLLDSARRYSVYFGKQPGDMRTTVRASIDVPSDKKIVFTVPPEGITQHADNSIVYRGALKSDLMVGTVFSKK